MRIYAIVNGKGGVGKTTLAVALAMCNAMQGRRVLLGDFDNQGNATGSFFELGKMVNQPNIFDVFKGKRIEPLAVMSKAGEAGKGLLDLLPATNDLLQLDKSVDTEDLFKLGDNLRSFYPGYDDIFLDTPGTLGTRVTMALTAADGVVLPTTMDDYAFQALVQLLRVMQPVHRALNPNMVFLGVIGNLIDGISKTTGEPVLNSERDAFRNLQNLLTELGMANKFLGMVAKLEGIKHIRKGKWTADKDAQRQLIAVADRLVSGLQQGNKS